MSRCCHDASQFSSAGLQRAHWLTLSKAAGVQLAQSSTHAPMPVSHQCCCGGQQTAQGRWSGLLISGWPMPVVQVHKNGTPTCGTSTHIWQTETCWGKHSGATNPSAEDAPPPPQPARTAARSSARIGQCSINGPAAAAPLPIAPAPPTMTTLPVPALPSNPPLPLASKCASGTTASSQYKNA
jgi:hypothetical protein